MNRRQFLASAGAVLGGTALGSALRPTAADGGTASVVVLEHDRETVVRQPPLGDAALTATVDAVRALPGSQPGTVATVVLDTTRQQSELAGLVADATATTPQRAFAGTATAAMTVGGTEQNASLATADGYDHQPSHVTLRFDRSALEKYRPRLVVNHLDVEVSDIYSWVATSPEYDTDMYCYWVFYAGGQEGVVDADSHIPDREPVYVEVDSSTGGVRTVHKDVYHYLNEPTPSDAMPMDGDHPKLRVIKPWHPYKPTTTSGALLGVSDMHTVYETWLELGWTVHQPSVVNPWRLKARNHWWPDGSYGITAKDDYWRAIYNTFGRVDGFGRDT